MKQETSFIIIILAFALIVAFVFVFGKPIHMTTKHCPDGNRMLIDKGPTEIHIYGDCKLFVVPWEEMEERENHNEH